MKPSRIKDVLDLALQARQNNFVFNPMFVGEAGLGKSEIVRQWVAEQNEKFKDEGGFGFVDLRLAYYEGPDFVGYPYEYEKDGVKRMGHALPHFWPTSGRGLILLEEPNRGNTMVMNCCMQLLTDRKVGPTYSVPEGWIIAGAMNPEGAKYDVNSMDTALADRFEFFDVEYDFNTFVEYIENNNWHQNIQTLIKSGAWVYKKPDAIGTDGKYIAPRTWSKMNAAEQAGVSSSPEKQQLHFIVSTSILGKHVGKEYWRSCWDDRPVLADDIINDRDNALNKIKQFSQSGNSYAGDKIATMIESIIANYGGWYEGRKNEDGSEFIKDESKIDEPTMAKIATIIPSDQAVTLIKGCLLSSHQHGSIGSSFTAFYQRNKECVEIMKGNIKISRSLDEK